MTQDKRKALVLCLKSLTELSHRGDIAVMGNYMKADFKENG